MAKVALLVELADHSTNLVVALGRLVADAARPVGQAVLGQNAAVDHAK